MNDDMTIDEVIRLLQSEIIVVHCPTEQSFNSFIKELEERGIPQRDSNTWNSYGKNTVVAKYIHGGYFLYDVQLYTNDIVLDFNRYLIEKSNSKQIHIWLTDKFPKDKTFHDYNSVTKALNDDKSVIHTTNTHFCKTTYMVDKGYRMFAHFKDEMVEIVFGCNNKYTDKEIREAHNLEKLLLNNGFGFID